MKSTMGESMNCGNWKKHRIVLQVSVVVEVFAVEVFYKLVSYTIHSIKSVKKSLCLCLEIDSTIAIIKTLSVKCYNNQQ